jgi:hypothetical protein
MPQLFSDLQVSMAPYAGDGGFTPTIVNRAINVAVKRLMESEQWRSLSFIMRMTAVGPVMPVPYNVETIEGASINGKPAAIYGTEYQFVSGGPGDMDHSHWMFHHSQHGGLADMGSEFPTMYDIPLDVSDYYVAAYTANVNDIGKVITVFGHLDNGQEVVQSVPLQLWYNGIEGALVGQAISAGAGAQPLADIVRVVLPANLTDYFSLYATSLSAQSPRFLSKYHPSVNVPTFRRYRLTNESHYNGAWNVATLLAQVKVKYVPLVAPTDVVPLDSDQAIQCMMQANQSLDNGDIQKSEMFEAKARKILAECQSSKQTFRGAPEIIDHDPVTCFASSLARWNHGL